jgi:polar amino acid transport system substrate-binding protein
MSSVAITPERKAKYDFSKPYFTAGQILVVPVELKDADMSGKTVGLLEGTSVPNAVFKKKGMRIRSYSDIERAFADMKKKTIDGVVCDFPVAGNYSVLKDEYKGMFILSGEPFTREDYGIVVKKGNKGLLEKINAGLDGVRKKGLDKRLEEKWLMGK